MNAAVVPAALLVAVGALIALTIVALGTIGVALIVHRHEKREDNASALRQGETNRKLEDIRKLTLRAIDGRAELERTVEQLRDAVNDHAEILELVPGHKRAPRRLPRP